MLNICKSGSESKNKLPDHGTGIHITQLSLITTLTAAAAEAAHCVPDYIWK